MIITKFAITSSTDMISIENAQLKVLENISLLKTVTAKVTESLGFVIAEDICSPINLPPFDQSAMDGYAVNGIHSKYNVVGRIKAGDNATQTKIEENETIRIYTGAMVPQGTAQVIMQEKISKISENEIAIKNKDSIKNKNIRYKGEELQKGEVAISKGTLINSAAIGLLSTLGISDIKVYSKPKVQIIETGSELVHTGEKLEPGKIYGSNGIMIQSLLESNRFICDTKRIEDDPVSTKDAVNKAIDSNDVVIITGGISVGDFDFVEEALEANEVNKIFYKINQKPGKPLFYGRKNNVHIFALPGNPAAALTCFFMYVLPCLKGLCGYNKPLNDSKKAVLSSGFTKNGNRTYLLKGLYKNGEVEILKGQSSAMLSAFVEANCLIKLNGDKSNFNKGDVVQCYPLT